MERRPRHSRCRAAGKETITITSRDVEIFELLSRYRYLRSSFIKDLLPHRSRQGILRSLRRLFDHGYINKPREQRRGYNDMYCPDVYELDVKGFQKLTERKPEVTHLIRKRVDGPVKNFAHAMMICDSMASIEIGLLGTSSTLITWPEILARTNVENPMKLPCAIRHTFPTGKTDQLETFVIPDGLFGIRREDGQASFFVLEAEHYNPIEPTILTRASFLKKLLAYRNIISSGVYKRQLKIPNMRVLVVAPTKDRITHMIELTERIAGQSNLFLFQHIPVQEEIFKAPDPFPSLFTESWKRAGKEPTTLI